MKDISVTLNWNESKIARIPNNATRGLLRMGYDMASLARSNSPYKTGALSNSIRVEENAGVVEVIAGGKMGGKDIRYAAIQEWGGYAGRGHKAHIKGKHYMERAKDVVMTGNYLQKYFGDLL